MSRSYQFGFALTTALGNVTRYENFRKYADRDDDVEAIWAPINHYLDPDPYRRVPAPFHTQLVLNREAKPVLDRWKSLDAVLVHGFQLFCSMTLRRTRRRPLLVLSQDYSPTKDLELRRGYGQDLHAGLYRSLRFQLERGFVRRADFYIPFNQWAADGLVEECGIERDRIEAIHVGVDLELWDGKRPEPGAVPRLLFVGGDFERKGGRVVLDAFSRLKHPAQVDLVTRSAPRSLPDGVTVYDDLQANDPRLRALYASAAVFVLPTRADTSPFVLLEAMASGCPVVSTRVAAVPEIVRDGVNGFLVDGQDPDELAGVINRLLDDPAGARQLGAAGRSIIERDYNAQRSSARILEIMKEQAAIRASAA
jgi:glycosyltransferase involved in cell wall biosynthesis